MKKEKVLPTPKNPVDSAGLDSAIVKEALRWVHKNEGFKADDGEGHYSSPRISSEILDCSMPMTFDHFGYCSYGCMYCFAYFFKSNNPSLRDNFLLKHVNVRTLVDAIQGKATDSMGKRFYNAFYKRRFLLHWGGLADPFCNFEVANAIGYKLIEALGEMNYPTLFSFKGGAIFDKKYVHLFEKYAGQRNFAFQVSMVTGSDTTGAAVEIGVPSPTRRLEAIRMLSDMGYWTILRLRPYIIGITDDTVEDLMARAVNAGIRAISTEFFALDSRANVGMKSRYDWLAKFIGVDNLMRYFSALSPSERGGYMRLNRDVKEQHIKFLYKQCQRHGLVFGCSDPDFKELNTSGSCCGMPDKYEPNPALQNWTRNQLTYHLARLRKEYHKTGKATKLVFGECFPSDVQYLNDPGFANDHVATIGYCSAIRKHLSQRDILQHHWNNLRSPANPRNYFHGKLMPTGLDADGNLVYRYNPMEYEARWKAEGIDLTR